MLRLEISDYCSEPVIRDSAGKNDFYPTVILPTYPSLCVFVLFGKMVLKSVFFFVDKGNLLFVN